MVAAAQQQDNHNNNTKLLSLSTISTAIGTGAAATGVIVTVPGFLSTRKQPKLLATYLLKIHNKYDELCKTIKPATKKIRMNIWTFRMIYVVTLYTCCKKET